MGYVTVYHANGCAKGSRQNTDLSNIPANITNKVQATAKDIKSWYAFIAKNPRKLEKMTGYEFVS